jgi:hypothetical protein
MGGWFVDIFVEWFVRMIVNDIKLVRSRYWTTVKGVITYSNCLRAGYGCHVTDVNYDYSVGGETHSGAHEEPFMSFSNGEEYAGKFPIGSVYPVRVSPRDPSDSVAAIG